MSFFAEGLKWPDIDHGIAGFEKTNPAYNNPGGLMYGPFAVQRGAVGKAGNGLAIFGSNEQGYRAMDDLVDHYAQQGYSITEMIDKWAPVGPNSQASNDNETRAVADAAGISETDSIIGAIVAQITGVPGGAAAGAVLGGSGIAGVGENWFTSNISRWASLAVGLICVLAGLFLFKPVRETVVEVGKTAANAAKVAAAAA